MSKLVHNPKCVDPKVNRMYGCTTRLCMSDCTTHEEGPCTDGYHEINVNYQTVAIEGIYILLVDLVSTVYISLNYNDKLKD